MAFDSKVDWGSIGVLKDLAAMNNKTFAEKYGVNAAYVSKKRREVLPETIQPRVSLDWDDPKIVAELKALTPTQFGAKYMVSGATISKYRRKHAISKERTGGSAAIPIPTKVYDRIGNEPDSSIAARCKVSVQTARMWRLQLGRESYSQKRQRNLNSKLRDKVVRLSAQGWTASEIARDLDVKPNRIQMVAQMFDIELRKHSFDRLHRNAAICLLRAFGFTLSDIGDFFNLSRERVRQVIEKDAKSALGRLGALYGTP